MIHLNKKKEIILMYIRDGRSQRQISKETGVSRETIRKYIRDYEEKLSEFNENLTEEDKTNIIKREIDFMSYLVCHIQKFKNNDVKGLQIHNQRESDKSKNIDIDKSKSHLI